MRKAPLHATLGDVIHGFNGAASLTMRKVRRSENGMLSPVLLQWSRIANDAEGDGFNAPGQQRQGALQWSRIANDAEGPLWAMFIRAVEATLQWSRIANDAEGA